MSTMASAALVGSIAAANAADPDVSNAGLSISVFLPRAPKRSTPQVLLQIEVLEQHLQIHRFGHTRERAGGQRVLLDRLDEMGAVHDHADVARIGTQLEAAAHLEPVELRH